MVKIAKFGPKAVATTYSFRGGRSGSSRSTNATCVMYEDRTNYVVFRLRGNGKASGSRGNRWKVLLYKVSSGRFAFRLVDPGGNILVTITRTGGVSNLMAAVNANATVSPIVNMQIIGTIADGTVFASSLTDYCKFNGGS
tara:strand:+ start:599 stop:1018 length:420 start_codon:yes stop_codon:yes gene_type:complete